MAANLMERDVQAGLEQAWHGMSKVVPVVTREVALPYEIERKAIECCPGFYYFTATDDGLMVGRPVGEDYVALTNERFWEIIQNSLGGSGAIVESAGTIYDRCRRFVTVKLGTDMDTFKVGDREFKNRISFLDSVDMSTNFYGVNSSTCVVCSNTFSAVMGDRTGQFRFKIRHSKNMVARIENMEKAIDEWLGVTAQFKAALEIANSEPMKVETARNVFAGFLAEDEPELSTRGVNTVNRLTELFQRGAGNRGETVLDAFSAVTDYYSHESSGGKDKEGFRQKQFLSSEFGSGLKEKRRFFDDLFFVDRKNSLVELKRDSISELASLGEQALKDAEMEAVAVN